MKRLLSYMAKYRKESLIAPLFKMLEASFELFVPLVVASMIDTGIWNQDIPYILKMGGILAALAVIGIVCSLTAQYFAAKAAIGAGTGLRNDLFAHINRLSYREIDQIGTATLITRMTNDINVVQNGVNMVLRLFLRSPFVVFGAMIMAFTVDVKGALVFVCAIPMLSVVVFGILLVSMPLYKKVQKQLDKVTQSTRETLLGVRVIRAFNRQESETRHFEEENTVLVKLQVFVGKISALLNPVTYVIINVAIVVLIWTGACQVNAGTLTQGKVVALVNYMSQILVELIKLANLIVTITKAIACGNRIQSVFELQPSLTDPAAQTGQKDAAAASAPSGNVGTASGRTAVPAVSFEHVCLTYKNAGAESLTDIDFRAWPGQTIGVIGGTGSGKSSLVNLIPRFYDATKGRVLVDGRDVKEYPLKELRGKIGMVLQKSVLFQGTIRENLLWGKEDASDEELYRALEIAQARDFVEEKDGGLDAVVAQGGKNLSGGQRQRLTIARALVRKPSVLILDDSASALDYATDARLRMAIRDMEGGPTVFIVSQRAASIRHADQIIVLDDGEVAGIGTHEQLLEGCAAYQEIYYSQFEKNAAKTGAENRR